MSTAFPSSNPVVRITVETGGGSQMTAVGRDAWALFELLEAGERGVTPLDQPAPRWSHYIFKFRRAGLIIETVDEKHGGAYSGTHARYVLRTPVQVVEIIRQNDRAAA